jgi:riboflavin biosynthesis pyrimidine reductase
MKPPALQHLTISANFAISADGKISSLSQRPSGWTSRLDFQRLLQLRREADAIFVGRRTLLADQMSLTIPDAARQPLRCVASATAAFSGEEKIFHIAGGAIHLWSPEPTLPAPAGVTLHGGSLVSFLHVLHHDHGVNHLHCEGGGTLLRMLAETVGIDQLHLTWAAHTLFGGINAATITGIPDLPFVRSQHYELTHFEPLPQENEVFLSYRLKRQTDQ